MNEFSWKKFKKLAKIQQILNEFFLPEYVYLYLKSYAGLEEIKTRCFGSIRQTLSIEDLKEIYIPNIPIEKQKYICNDAKKL